MFLTDLHNTYQYYRSNLQGVTHDHFFYKRTYLCLPSRAQVPCEAGVSGYSSHIPTLPTMNYHIQLELDYNPNNTIPQTDRENVPPPVI